MSNTESIPPPSSRTDQVRRGEQSSLGNADRMVAATHGAAGPHRRRRGIGGAHRLAVLAAVVVFTVSALGIGWRSGIAGDAGGTTPGTDSADAGFLRDMIVHHDQAVAMAFLMRDRSADNLLDAIATDIIINQLIQIGMMRGYLSIWDLPSTTADPAMAWMGHPVPVGTLMPGMASAEETERLRTLPLPEAEILFYRLMIRHHASGIEMAQAGIARVETTLARELAESIVPVQFNEIQLMQQELFVRGQDPEPILDASGMGAMAGMGADGSSHGTHEMSTPSS